MSCIFCNIIDQVIPAELVYQDEQVVAFNDMHPQAATHVLIIPREHIATLNDLNKQHTNLVGHMVQTAQHLAKQYNHDKDGYRLVMNCNKDGGQTVFHIHLHLLAGRPMQWPPG